MPIICSKPDVSLAARSNGGDAVQSAFANTIGGATRIISDARMEEACRSREIGEDVGEDVAKPLVSSSEWGRHWFYLERSEACFLSKSDQRLPHSFDETKGLATSSPTSSPISLPPQAFSTTGILGRSHMRREPSRASDQM